jgi:hypothetical protein
MAPAIEIAWKDSSTDFFPPEQIAISDVNAQRRQPGRFPMIFAGSFVRRLSVVTAYLAFAFVGAIVLGVF